NKGMTRAMFAAVMGRLYERSYGTLSTSGASQFKDVSASSWYGTYVNWAAQNGIIKGISDTSFEPNRNITREEMAALLYRFASFMKVNNTINTDQKLTFKDASSIGAWAKPAVQFFAQKEILNGRSSTQFAPKQTATRAETAAVLERFIELVVAQAAQ
ncbi:S-layer homology domain-containing protein, partial [Paenibacillus campi]|uniref:S-layer homology domain-containing protein n=1 Tax=Paenibacillus campi TaxID=3106031 RepID=UPI002AFFDA66